MGCFGDREKGSPDQTQKWDFITLSDFRCTSTLQYFAYGWLWFMALVGCAVYGLDTSTAVNLLVYNKWSSEVQPALPLKYSRWIFAGCIILSWVLLAYEWIRAVHAIRSGGVANCYMNPLAVSIQSMRKQGFKRFLVFSDLTKSKKGVDYLALFTYFAFKGAFRVILAEGPRQVVNGMTLYAVLTADLLPTGSSSHSGIEQFFLNLEALAGKSKVQTAVYISMLFTLIIWVISAISLIFAFVMYLLFLWHYIPSADGTLSKYCRRKIDKRLGKLVEHKVKAAIEEDDRRAQKAERKAELKRQKTGDPSLPSESDSSRKPTLPVLDSPPKQWDDDDPAEFPLVRKNTGTTVDTLPLYSGSPLKRNGSSRSTTQQPNVEPGMRRPQMPSRSGTGASGWSNGTYSSEAPLLANAGYAGAADQLTDVPRVPPMTLQRQESRGSNWGPAGMEGAGPRLGAQRPFTPGMRQNTPGPMRSMTPLSRNGSPYSQLPDQGPSSGYIPPVTQGPPPVRTNTPYRNDQGAQMNGGNFGVMRDPSGRPIPLPSRPGTANPFGPPPAGTGPRWGRDTSGRPTPPPMRPGTANPYTAYPTSATTLGRNPNSRQQSFSRPIPPQSRNQSQDSGHYQLDSHRSQVESETSSESYEMTSRPSHSFPVTSSTPPPGPTAQPGNPYTAFKPIQSSSREIDLEAATAQSKPMQNEDHSKQSLPSTTQQTESPVYAAFRTTTPANPPSHVQSPSTSSTYQAFSTKPPDNPNSTHEPNANAVKFGLTHQTSPDAQAAPNTNTTYIRPDTDSASRNLRIATGAEDGYFGHAGSGSPLRVSRTPTINSRHTIEYGDIFDDYAPSPHDDESPTSSYSYTLPPPAAAPHEHSFEQHDGHLAAGSSRYWHERG